LLVIRRTIPAALLALILLASLQAPLHAVDRKPPRISKAAMVDKDENGLADRVVLTYTERIAHRADDDGTYPFRVVGYKLSRIGRAKDTKRLTLLLQEKAKTDPGAAPNVLYDRGRDEAVYDRAGNEAHTQTFKNTKPFVAVPEGSSLLIVNVEGPGTVTTLDGTFTCDASCYQVVSDTIFLMLNAKPAEGSTFSGWSGACADSGTQPLCTLVMDADKSVGAAFE
jgi:hypothetical protein